MIPALVFHSIIVVSLTCTANQYGSIIAEYGYTVKGCDANEAE
ncbi:hypothetical protein ACQ33O_05055 [Ferruginibacter sp. SUN002]